MDQPAASRTPWWVLAVGAADLAVLLVMLWTFPDTFDALAAWATLSVGFGFFGCSCALVQWVSGRLKAPSSGSHAVERDAELNKR